ncbi:MAG: Hsp20/alpha crystallin family protein [Phycisphaerales bacterium]|nr:MAG: Hsp20/alpha crystallin family protein [Phycisphaerales bacterium]
MRRRTLFESSPLGTLRREVDRLFHRFMPPASTGEMLRHPLEHIGCSWLHAYPPTNVWEDNGTLYLEAELPGMREDEIDVTISGHELVLKGTPKPEEMPEGATPLIRERDVPSFSRVIHLPVEIDQAKITATLENGILTLTMPKTESARSRQIKVRPVAGAV